MKNSVAQYVFIVEKRAILKLIIIKPKKSKIYLNYLSNIMKTINSMNALMHYMGVSITSSPHCQLALPAQAGAEHQLRRS